MKSNIAVFVVFSLLLLVANLSCASARKNLGGYWKDMMKDQPMPQAIKDLVDEDSKSEASDAAGKKDRFIRNFSIKPNVILYHTLHAVSIKQKQKLKPFVNNQDSSN